ncbi:hypothetical protein LEP1GSC068_1338 [Leptospira sp. Fiocruz LV3954]|nr:hypothetical protein LEP1GSC068_1338 [Leptospira sp. Fiocruz LV3954]EMI61786.1 hypothetical protein LEP1GSC076_0795 [Leptospira sp. Fiocruz LV4135]
MKIAVYFCMTLFSFNLLTGAESPVSEKLERSSNVEYNKILKYKTMSLAKTKLVEDFSNIMTVRISFHSILNSN